MFAMLLGDTIFLDTLDDANAYRHEVSYMYRLVPPVTTFIVCSLLCLCTKPCLNRHSHLRYHAVNERMCMGVAHVVFFNIKCCHSNWVKIFFWYCQKLPKISLVSFWIGRLIYKEWIKAIISQADPYDKTGDAIKLGRGCKIWLHQNI